MIELRNIQWGEVLLDVSLQLQPGELVALVGRNGAGKSTLLKIAAGLLVPDAGQVIVDGVEHSRPEFGERCRRHLGLVFQNPETQLVSNTVEEEVAFGPGQLGVSPQALREQVTWALQRVGLADRFGWQSQALSAGQKQRLALASILAIRPAMLLLDEPTSMLDSRASQELFALLDELKALGIGILLITHRGMDAAVADRVLELHEGRLRSAAAPSAPQAFEALGLDTPDTVKLAHWNPDVPTLPYSARPLELKASPAVAALDLDYTYAPRTPLAHQALRELSCHFPSAACSALVGRTGSGKSTLLEHLNLLLRPQRGTLSLLGETVTARTSAQAVRRRVSLMFQQPEHGFFCETAWEEVCYGPGNFGLDAPTLARQALERVGLPVEEYGGRHPHDLSGGEQRRLALAAALACDPEILVLDEPSANLDPASRQSLWTLLEGLKQAGTTLVLVSHDLEEVGRLADHLVWLDGGRLKAEGAPSELFPSLEEAGFRVPAWSSWSARQRPGEPVPVSESEFLGWAAIS